MYSRTFTSIFSCIHLRPILRGSLLFLCSASRHTYPGLMVGLDSPLLVYYTHDHARSFASTKSEIRLFFF